MKKILILLDSIDPNDSSGVKGRLALINNLVKIGHQVKIIHLDENYTNDVSFQAEVSGRSFLSSYLWLTKLNTFVKKLNIKLNKWVEPQFGFSFSHYEDVARFKKALTRENPDHYDIVFTLSKAASFRPHKAVLESPKWHSKWYAYVHDPYPFHCYPRPYDWIGPGDNQKMRFMKQVFKKATYVSFPSNLLAEWMCSYYPVNKHKIKIIPHQIDSNLKAQKENLPHDFDLKKVNLLYAGALLGHRPLKALLISYKQLLEQSLIPKNTVLWFVGGGLNDFRAQIEEIKGTFPDNIKTLSQVKFEVAFAMQNFAEINIVIESNSYISPFLPGKLPHLIQANKPILHIGPVLSEVSNLLDGENFFLTLTHQEIKKQKELLADFINTKNHLNLGNLNNFSEELLQYFSVEKLKNIIEID